MSVTFKQLTQISRWALDLPGCPVVLDQRGDFNGRPSGAYILVFPSATLDYEALSLGRVSVYPEFP